MSASCVWRYWERLSEPTRMVCKLCGSTLATNNCGNAKKHMRYKHLAEFLQVQAEDGRLRGTPKPTNERVAGVKRKNTGREHPKRLTIDEISALLMPKMEPIDDDDNAMSPSATPNESNQSTEDPARNADEEDEQPGISLLRRAIRIKAVELVLDIEGCMEPVRISFPCEGNTDSSNEMMRVLGNLS